MGAKEPSAKIYQDLLMLQAQVAEEINGSGEPTQVLARVLDLVACIPSVTGTWIWSLEGNTQPLRLAQSHGLDGETHQRLTEVTPDSPLMKQINSGEEVSSNREQIWGDVPASDSCQMGVWPLCPQGRAIGALGALCGQPDGWPEPVVLFMRSLANQLSGLIGHDRQIADLRQNNFNLDCERELLTTAVEQSADSILITNAKGAIKYVNPAFLKMTGYSREEVLGRNPRILKSGVHKKEFYREMWGTLHQGKVWQGKVTNRGKDGIIFHEVATISPIRDKAGIITHFVGVKKDITREKELEDRLLQSQKMEAIGTLAGGIAHDFNNILYALMGYTQLAMDDVPTENPAIASLEEILKAGNRASDLVGKMLTLGGRDKSEMGIMELGPVVQEALDLARASLPRTIQFDVDLESSQGKVDADPTQIHQVVLNLCTNAEYAMRQGRGTLTVHLHGLTVSGEDLERWPGLIPGQYMCLEVSDTGLGMDDETLARIFEPYFTTKDANEGTGLGLATVQGIMLNHGGKIFAESALGVGTTFQLLFPAEVLAEAAWPIGAQVEDRQESPSSQQEGRILVLDDEEMIVDVQTKALTRQGYRVAGFTQGDEALAALEQDPGSFDLVITDQIMPNMTGLEFIGNVLSIRPGLPIIMTTGYSEQLNEAELLAAGITKVLSKPLRINKLSEVVNAVLTDQRLQIEV